MKKIVKVGKMRMRGRSNHDPLAILEETIDRLINLMCTVLYKLNQCFKYDNIIIEQWRVELRMTHNRKH